MEVTLSREEVWNRDLQKQEVLGACSDEYYEES